MAHFAKLDENNVVLEVHGLDNSELLVTGLFRSSTGEQHYEIESEDKGIQFLTNWSKGYTNWRQTSYNGNFRKNFAGIGFVYDAERDAFIPPKPYNSWTLNENTCQWEPLVAKPDMILPTTNKTGIGHNWNEETTSWDEVVIPKLTA